MIAANIVRDDRETGFMFLKALDVTPELIEVLMHKSYGELISDAEGV